MFRWVREHYKNHLAVWEVAFVNVQKNGDCKIARVDDDRDYNGVLEEDVRIRISPDTFFEIGPVIPMPQGETESNSDFTMRAALALWPDSTIEEDNDGQIVVYTSMESD